MPAPACVASAANFLAFMETNIVHVSFSPNWGVSGRYDFYLAQSDRVTVRDGGACALYRLDRPGTAQLGESFRAYWCHYQPDEMHSIVVGNGANFMFTATMNGCSLAFGSKLANGGRRVAHANRSDTMQARENRQWDDLQGHFTGKSDIDGVLQPTHYMSNGGIKVTTFGIRDPHDNDWDFYYQSYDTTNNQAWRHLGVKRVPLI